MQVIERLRFRLIHNIFAHNEDRVGVVERKTLNILRSGRTRLGYHSFERRCEFFNLIRVFGMYRGEKYPQCAVHDCKIISPAIGMSRIFIVNKGTTKRYDSTFTLAPSTKTRYSGRINSPDTSVRSPVDSGRTGPTITR